MNRSMSFKEEELRRLIQQELMRLSEPIAPTSVRVQGLPLLLEKAEALRAQARLKSGWTPGLLLTRRQRRATENLAKIRGSFPQLQVRPSEGENSGAGSLLERFGFQSQREVQQQPQQLPQLPATPPAAPVPVKVEVRRCPCGFETSSATEFYQHEKTAHKTTIKSY